MSPTKLSIIENIIENVAKFLNVDPLAIRKLNLYKKGDKTPTGKILNDFNVDILIDNLLVSSDYNKRLAEINTFNQNNRWKKKGISFTCLSWEAFWTNCMNFILNLN